MIRSMRSLLLSSVLLGVLALAACGGGTTAEEAEFLASRPGTDSSEPAVGAPARPAPPAAAVAPAAPALPRAAVAPAAAATPAPAAAAPAPAPGLPTLGGDISGQVSSTEEQAALVAQQRIIVRTVDMHLVVVTDVSASLDSVADMAEELGGWVVSSDRSQKHRGFISIRVPADKLDNAVLRLRDMAVEVDSEVSTSKDVTDEYVDTTARLRNLEATEDSLLKLLDRAEKVEDALSVQRELTTIQAEIERFLGRIKFLEQTSAFSLINVSLRLAPADMPVDAGLDQTLSVGQVSRFRASFKPPDGIEDFVFTWDFGDGSPLITSDRTAPTLDEDTRVTATVAHVYADDRDSPFITEVKIMGTGEAGVAEGQDTLIATVTKLPVIEVFSGESRIVDEDDEVEFSGSFTRPKGLHDLTFKWDFGDGTSPVTGSLEEGITRAAATHEYTDHRPFAFTATLTITGQGDAGEVEASNSLSVLVEESRGWAVSGWSPGDTGKTAVRGLSGIGIGLGYFAIFLAIFSPLWIALAVGALYLRRRARRRSPTLGGPGQDSD